MSQRHMPNLYNTTPAAAAMNNFQQALFGSHAAAGNVPGAPPSQVMANNQNLGWHTIQRQMHQQQAAANSAAHTSVPFGQHTQSISQNPSSFLSVAQPRNAAPAYGSNQRGQQNQQRNVGRNQANHQQQAAHQQQQQVSMASNNMHAAVPSIPIPLVDPGVKLVSLPFYDIHTQLIPPSSLISQGNARFQESTFTFTLSVGQATVIASNRDMQQPPMGEYLYQLQLRFCQMTLEKDVELNDEFPSSIGVQVNGKGAALPNPIPTNKPGVEPRRPPRPVNITPFCKLSPYARNNVTIRWSAEYGKCFVSGIWLVKKLTSADLLERLNNKEVQDEKVTRKLIVEKLNDDEDVAMTNLKVSVTCPLGKSRMKVPCRSVKCNHLQCFDASLFIQMNEKKPTWICPVCDKKLKYDEIVVDGYFLNVLNSSLLAKYETDIIIQKDGSWKPIPTEGGMDSDDSDSDGDHADRKPPLPPGGPGAPPPPPSSSSGGCAKGISDGVECVDLSDDESSAVNRSSGGGPPTVPAPPTPTSIPPPPPSVSAAQPPMDEGGAEDMAIDDDPAPPPPMPIENGGGGKNDLSSIPPPLPNDVAPPGTECIDID